MTILKGSTEHASQHRHGIQVADTAPTPKTLEQRVAAIEQLIFEESGMTVAETLAMNAARRDKARRVEAAQSVDSAQGEAAGG